MVCPGGGNCVKQISTRGSEVLDARFDSKRCLLEMYLKLMKCHFKIFVKECAVPRMAVFRSSTLESLPGTASRCF